MTEQEKRELVTSSLQLLSDSQHTENVYHTLMQIKDTINQKKIDKLQFKNFISKSIASKMLSDLPETKNRYLYEKQMDCQHTITWKSGNKTSKHCWVRTCPVCNSIRSAKMINAYKESLASKKELWFVTLTAQTCQYSELKHRMAEMQKIFTRILATNRHLNRKTPSRNIPLNGLRKLELIVAVNKKYHAHYHIIMDSKKGAEHLKNKWVEYW